MLEQSFIKKLQFMLIAVALIFNSSNGFVIAEEKEFNENDPEVLQEEHNTETTVESSNPEDGQQDSNEQSEICPDAVAMQYGELEFNEGDSQLIELQKKYPACSFKVKSVQDPEPTAENNESDAELEVSEESTTDEAVKDGIEPTLCETEVFYPFADNIKLGEILSKQVTTNNDNRRNQKKLMTAQPSITYEWFEEVVGNAIESREDIVSIEEYQIPYSKENSDLMFSMQSRYVVTHPEYFFVLGAMCRYYVGGVFKEIIISYNDEYTESDILAFNSKVDEIVSGVDNNWSDTEKALYLHDYLVTHCDYDTTYSNYSAFDAIITGSSVCQGYALAYECLLKKVGVGTDYIVSDTLNHAWTCVQIDGKSYFTDATWDDPLQYDIQAGKSFPLYQMYCDHEHFLRNSDQFSKRHGGTDWVSSNGENVRYAYTDVIENDFWINTRSVIPHVEREWMYIDENQGYVTYNFENNETSQISFSYHKDPYTWNPKYTSITSAKNNFYFSRSDAVYKVSPSDHAAIIFAELTDEDQGFIYGIRSVTDNTGTKLLVDLASGECKNRYLTTKIIELSSIKNLSILLKTADKTDALAMVFDSSLPEKAIRSELRTGDPSGDEVEPSGYEDAGIHYFLLAESDIYIALSQKGYVPFISCIGDLTDNEAIELCLIGDAKRDNEIDVADLSLASSYILSSTEIVNESTDAADYDRNSVIDVKDLALISNRILSGN